MCCAVLRRSSLAARHAASKLSTVWWCWFITSIRCVGARVASMSSNFLARFWTFCLMLLCSCASLPPNCARISSRSGTICSTAAEGVGALWSAAKSAIVKSVSCPTAETTGILDAKMARATLSSLNAQRSSMLPPPRPTIRTSLSARRFITRIACAICAAACSP